MKRFLSVVLGLLSLIIIFTSIQSFLNFSSLGLTLYYFKSCEGDLNLFGASIFLLSVFVSSRIGMALFYRNIKGNVSREGSIQFNGLLFGILLFDLICCFIKPVIWNFLPGNPVILELIFELLLLVGVLYWYKMYTFRKYLLLSLEGTKFQENTLITLTSKMREWSNWRRNYLLSAISKISPLDRKSVIEHSLCFINLNTSQYGIEKLLEIISEISHLDRKAVIEHSLRIITAVTPDLYPFPEDVSKIITLISHIPIDKRNVLVEKSLSRIEKCISIDEYMGLYERVRIFQEVLKEENSAYL